MPRTVCLDEEKHSVTMLRSVKRIKHEEDFCDFTIKVNNNEFHVHRVIIAAGSPYFKAMLKHDTKESQEGKVEMKNVDAECVKQCIDFMYSGKFDIPDGKIGKLLHVAIMMQVDNVKAEIGNILEKELNDENFYETRNLVDMYNLQALSVKCQKYYGVNFAAIHLQPGFVDEKLSNLVNVLKSDQLRLSEKEKFSASLKWVGENHDREKSLPELIELVNLSKVSSEYLSDLLENHVFISTDLALFRMISAPLVQYAKTYKQIEQMVLFNEETDILQSFNPATNEITNSHNEHFKQLLHFTAISTGSYIYVLCHNQSVHRLDFENDSAKWECMEMMLAYHGFRPPSAVLSGSLYVIASSDRVSSHSFSAQPSRNVERFDLDTKQWLALNDKPTPITEATLVSMADSIYCIGGMDNAKPLDSFCKFTPPSRWVDLEPMRTARSNCGAIAVGQKLFVMAGWNGCDKVDEVESFDAFSGQWTFLCPTLHSHGRSVAHYIDRWIFLVSGFGENVQIEKYDLGSNRWEKVELRGIDCCKVYSCSLVEF